MPKQYASIKLGGRVRHLRYDFNALVALEEVLGSPMSEVGNLVSGSVRLKDLRAIIWAGLLHEDKSLTEEDVGGWIEIPELADVADKIRQAFELMMPDAGESKNSTGPQKKKNGAGENT